MSNAVARPDGRWLPVWPRRMWTSCDLYNLFNANTPTTYETVYDPATNGARWMQPTAVLLPRFMRFNVQVDF